MHKINIIKIGGSIIDDHQKLELFLQQFAQLPGKKILVHGGGKLATRMAEQMGIQQEMVEGRRITDEETLRVVTMVYAGYINKNIVAQLKAKDCKAVGICGADADIIRAHKRDALIDYGYVGDIDTVRIKAMKRLLKTVDTIVIAPITHDGAGQLLNTNADTIAQEVAKALSNDYKTQLIFSFEKAGVLLDIADDASVITKLKPKMYKQLKKEDRIFAGMIPKLDNAFAALKAGVHRVYIGQAEHLPDLLEGRCGTKIEI
jgi:acetylglutamate kinase